MKKPSKIKILTLIMFLGLFYFLEPSQATQYFYFDAEDGNIGDYLPNPDSGGGPNFWPYGGNDAIRGRIESVGGAAQGSQYFYWQTVNLQDSAYQEINDRNTMPVQVQPGRTYYLAYFFRFDLINGIDIWHETGDSADKGVEMRGNGIRWTLSRGHWGNLADNQDHHYTVWLGNPTYQLNPELQNYDIFLPNQNGYSQANPIQFEYGKWYAAVMAVKMATDNTGSAAFWINGVQISEYINIKTGAYSNPSISHILMGGTIAQPAYDAPAHYRKFDALILTDNWQDIVNGGYLQDPNQGSDTAPPIRSNGQPTGSLSAGTTSTAISLTTNENANCRYSTTANTAYASMTNTFSTTGGTSHSTTISGLQNGVSYNYYVKCRDQSNNANIDDFVITFSVSSYTTFSCTSETPQSQWIMCMDFDGANPPANWPTCGGASWQGWQVMGWDCSNPDYFNPTPGISSLSTITKYSGTRSLMLGKQAGCHAATQTWYDWSAAYPNVTKLHVRMYINFDSSWLQAGVHPSDYYNPPADTDNYWHILLLNQGAWTHGIDIYDSTDLRPWDPYICWRSYSSGNWYSGPPYVHPHGLFFGFRGLEPYQAGPSSSSGCWNIKEHTNEWHSHEWMFELHTPTEIHWRHWVDGVLMADRVFTGLNPVTNWNKIHLDQWFSPQYDAHDHEIKTYFDNIVIATDYIGPIGSSSQYHRADTNQNGCIESQELISFISQWKNSIGINLQEVIEAIMLWKNVC